MKLLNTYELVIKKSKFIAYYYEINTQEDANIIIDKLKLEHKKARHIPYAYKVNNTAKKTDDKEPNNTAGLPIYNLIEINNLDNCLIAVVRYFGGVKLGAGGLTRAYITAAKEVIKL